MRGEISTEDDCIEHVLCGNLCILHFYTGAVISEAIIKFTDYSRPCIFNFIVYLLIFEVFQAVI